MNNSTNPLALFMARMQAAGTDQGALSDLMQKFFRDNYGKTDLPKTVADFAIYDQQVMTAGTTKLFQGAYTVNRSNMPTQNFQLPQSEHAIILGIKMMDGSAAGPIALDLVNWQPGIRNAVAKNATMDIQANTTRIAAQLPLTLFDPNELSATVSGATHGNRGIYYLNEPYVWLGQTSFPINININQAPTADYAIRLELHGIRFIGS